MGMKAIITVVGKDTVGILATVSAECAKHNANIIDVSQTIMQDMFCMIMMVEVNDINLPFNEFGEAIKLCGKDKGLSIHVMHEDIFNSMHRI